jgi:hypothetical protein
MPEPVCIMNDESEAGEGLGAEAAALTINGEQEPIQNNDDEKEPPETIDTEPELTMTTRSERVIRPPTMLEDLMDVNKNDYEIGLTAAEVRYYIAMH